MKVVRLVGAIVAGALAQGVAGEVVTVRYSLDGEYAGAGRQALYGFIGVDRPNGTFRRLDGYPIVAARARFTVRPRTYTDDSGQTVLFDVADLIAALDVPVELTPPGPTTFLVLGTQLTPHPSGDGRFVVSIDTNEYNGVARAGRYELNLMTVEQPDGSFPALHATLSEGSGFEIDIDAPPECVADVDDGTGTGTPDGGVDISDLLYYIALFESGDLASDIDDGNGEGVPDGGVTIDDLLYYLARYEAGC